MRLSKKTKKNFEEDNLFYIRIGKKIRQARRTKINEFTGKKTVVPLTKVAEALNCSYQQIGKYEKGSGKEGNRIPLVNLVKISKFLKKPLSYFLDDWEDTNTIADKFNTAFQTECERLQDNQ